MSHLEELLKPRQQDIFNRCANGPEDYPNVSIRRDFLVERYKHGESSLHLHFLSGNSARNGEQGFCAIIAGCSEAVNLGAQRIKDGIPATNSGDRERYPSMLVDVRELLQDKEGVLILSPLTCVVRLQPLNLCERLWGHSEKGISLPAFHGGVIKGLSGATDGELVTFLGLVSGGEYQLPYKIIEGTAQAMHAVADYERDVFGDRNLDAETLNLSPRVWVRLDHQFAQVGVCVPKFLGIECLKVMLCPRDFLPHSV